MDNLVVIEEIPHLANYMEMSQTKLVIFLYYSKQHTDSRRIRQYLENICQAHHLIQICIIDIDKTGIGKKNPQMTGRLDFIHKKNVIISYQGYNVQEIENQIKAAEQQYIMSLNKNYSYPATNSGGFQGVTNGFPNYPQPNPQMQAPCPNPSYHQESRDNLPSLEQMQQMFQIFQMMQQMGVLQTSPKTTAATHDGIIQLPDGDKIVPLADGKYGLIRKKN